MGRIMEWINTKIMNTTLLSIKLINCFKYRNLLLSLHAHYWTNSLWTFAFVIFIAPNKILRIYHPKLGAFECSELVF
jgi:hypothetical protein